MSKKKKKANFIDTTDRKKERRLLSLMVAGKIRLAS